MTESPSKISKKIPKKGPYISKKHTTTSKANRRFSILSNSDSNSDDSDDSDSDSNYDDHIYLHKHKLKRQQQNNATVLSSASEEEEEEEDGISSSSDDENVDFVQLTKQRRLKAMKAVKKLKNQVNSSISPSPNPESPNLIEQEEPELDDDLVDAVIEKEERKLKDLGDDNDNDTNTNINNNTSMAYSEANDDGDDDDDDDDDFEAMDFDFSFDDNANTASKDSKNVLDQLRDEDIGEEVIEEKKPSSNTSSPSKSKNKNSTSKPPNDNAKIDIDVPKFNDKEINSDADYEFDNDDLIETLLKDNDDLELQNLDNSDDDFDPSNNGTNNMNDEDDDFDYLIANQHKIDQNSIINRSTSKDLSLDSTNDAYLMREETQAMLEDFDKTSKSMKNRRSSMYYQNQPFNISNDEELDDLDLDLLNNFEQFLPKQQANTRRRSSILNQTLLSSSDDDEEGDADLDISMGGTKPTRRLNSKKKLKKVRKLTNNTNAYAKDIRKMLGISNSDSNFTSKFSSNAIVDSDDDTKLLEYIFEESDSENGTDTNNNKMIDDGNETDEDMNLPKKSGKILGSKHAKEILSSNTDQFRAPKLGSFIVTKKPFSVIDGFSTRFLHPIDGNHSVMQKAAALTKNETETTSSISNNNIALDELINISEFDEDYSNADSKEDFDEFFGDKRIPLTAFRNKTTTSNNNPNHDLNLNARRFSFTDRNNHLQRRRYSKSSKSILKSSASQSKYSRSDLPSNNNSGDKTTYKLKKSSFSQPQAITGVLVPKSSTSLADSNNTSTINDSTNNSLIHDNTAVDEVLLIGVESIPTLSETFEISAPHQHQLTSQRKRKSMSRSSKARYRRASMVEAHAEGLRQTKNGLFDEHIMDDVEALLIDMGDAEEYGFLFGNEM